MAAKGGDSSAGETKPKVNIFNKDKEKPKKQIRVISQMLLKWELIK